MEANKLAYTSYEPSWKEVLYTDVSGPSTPSGSFEPETASVTNLVTLAPCSSPAVLKSYLTTILQPYGIAISIFKHLTPGDAFRWMLASKDMMEVLSRDPKLIQLMLDKHCIRRPAPRLMAPCEWCSCFGCECAGCFTWDHNGYGELNAIPHVTNPDKRLCTFCTTCTKKLPKSVFNGRCLCNTKNLRSLCYNCKHKERVKLINAGLHSWFSAREKLREEGEEAMEGEHGKLCNGVGDDGHACVNVVGLVCVGEGAEGAEGAEVEKVVNCCTWCGLVAVDVPINRPPGCTKQLV